MKFLLVCQSLGATATHGMTCCHAHFAIPALLCCLKTYMLHIWYPYSLRQQQTIKFTSQASRDPSSTLKIRAKQSLLGLEYLIFSHFTLNISGQQCMGLEAALVWKSRTFRLTKKLPCKQFHLQKTIEPYCDLWKLFYSK